MTEKEKMGMAWQLYTELMAKHMTITPVTGRPTDMMIFPNPAQLSTLAVMAVNTFEEAFKNGVSNHCFPSSEQLKKVKLENEPA